MTSLTCPECNSVSVYAFSACHTWVDADGKWMSCFGCGSAVNYSCDDEEGCGKWSYTHGLNPNNPRQAKQGVEPSWLLTDETTKEPLAPAWFFDEDRYF